MYILGFNSRKTHTAQTKPNHTPWHPRTKVGMGAIERLGRRRVTPRRLCVLISHGHPTHGAGRQLSECKLPRIIGSPAPPLTRRVLLHAKIPLATAALSFLALLLQFYSAILRALPFSLSIGCLALSSRRMPRAGRCEGRALGGGGGGGGLLVRAVSVEAQVLHDGCSERIAEGARGGNQYHVGKG